ncbi:MAG: L-serine ammonia-lyase, iron-sulfur-dependent, subunit alpha [Promethearchaeota archaeon]
MFESLKELKKLVEKKKLPLHEMIILREMELSGKTRDYILEKLQKSIDVMKSSLENGIKVDVVLPIRTAMEQSQKMQVSPFFLSKDIKEAAYWAMSIAEYNSGMGRICATPTAGSCGVFPAVLFKAKEMFNKNNTEVLHAFIVGAVIGVICGNNATISGSEGGCQAEIGVASAMAASAICYLRGGGIDRIIESVAIALKSLMGLICDPVAGLVISPCVKRNAIGTLNAFLAAEMALSGVTSIIPADEVIDAMKSVGEKMPFEHKETGLGGIANTKTAKLIKKTLFSDN